MLLHVRLNLESCHVIDRHAKVVLAVYVLPAELNHVLAVAGNQTLCGRGYGITYETVTVKSEGEIISAVTPPFLKVTSRMLFALPRLAVTSTPDSLATVGSWEPCETMRHMPWMLIMRYD